MKYKFYTKIVSNSKYFLIDNETNNPLENFGDDDWTPAKVQEIIDGVENSREKEFDNRYVWANEDVYLLSFKEGVAFYDLMADRAGIKRDKQDLDITHDEFIQFLTDFKQFVEENA